MVNEEGLDPVGIEDGDLSLDNTNLGEAISRATEEEQAAHTRKIDLLKMGKDRVFQKVKGLARDLNPNTEARLDENHANPTQARVLVEITSGDGIRGLGALIKDLRTLLPACTVTETVRYADVVAPIEEVLKEI